jgi:hypothetical protein
MPFIAIILSFICFTGWKLAHAQDAATSDETVTDTNIDWNSMSDAEVELKAIEMTTPIPASQLPDSGTLWSAQHSPVSLEPWPPLPIGFLNVPAWPLGDDVFVLDDLNVNYSALAQAATRQKASGIRAMDEEGGDFSPDFSIPTNGLWLQITGVSNSLAYLTLNGTTQDVEYEILSKTALTNSTWSSEGLIWGSAVTNWTATTDAQNGRSNLFFWARSWQDSTGSGIPDWWWLKYFGQDTNVDAYADPDGDGWNNLQEFQNGTDPTVFNTPPTSQGLTFNYTGSNSVNISWTPSPGPVTSYTLQKLDWVTGATNTYSIATNDDNFEDSLSSDPLYDPSANGPEYAVNYQLQANYAGGSSPVAEGWLPLATAVNPPYVRWIYGPNGSAYIAASALSSDTVAVKFTRIDDIAEENYNNAAFNTNFTVSIGSFTNGLYLIPTSWQPATDSYGNSTGYSWFAQTVNANGDVSQITALWTLYDGFTTSGYFYNSFSYQEYGWLAPPYYDGRAQLKQNLIFLLREPNENNALQLYQLIGDGEDNFYTPSTSYVHADFYSADNNGYPQNSSYGINVFRPFEDNYLYRNFVFSTTNIDSGGALTTGIVGPDGYETYLYLNYPPTFLFQSPPSGTNISSLLATNQTRWLVTYTPTLENDASTAIGFSYDGSWTLGSSEKNYWGLPYLSAELAYNDGSGLTTTTLSAGNSFSDGGANVYMETAQPQFQTAEYDFWDAGIATYANTLPGMSAFSPTNQSQLIIWDEGTPHVVAGYAKLSVQNGNSGVYGYLGQYFDKAEVVSNGVVMTNTTGVLSPYGNFLPTQPGPIALVTMPDVDTGARGTDVVYVIKLQLDVNHDGNMDTSFGGPDNTSTETPFNFWVNDNYDRWDYDSDDNTNYEDDLGPTDVAYLPTSQQVPDCQYTTNGFPAIPDTRDLEDYARLWTSGISNAMKALPANYTVQLVLSGDSQLRVFKAFESNGGTNYLSDETTASNQVANSTSLYVGLLTSSSPLVLGTGTNVSEHYIFCGAQAGSAQVDLQILDPSQNVVGDATAYLQINEIKQMYERWTVGEEPSQPPKTTPVPAVDNVTTAFLYTPPTSTNTPYILLVHGWNLETWNKDRWAETAFKRLYWQGYQGRFGEFRWPTGYGFAGWYSIATNFTEKDNFDNSEYQAWQSAVGLTNLLDQLNIEYPGQVYMLAHSMGNVVAGEALRLEGTNQVVKSYVASQAAVSAHTYNTNIANYSFYYPPWSYHADTPNIYGNWFAGNNGGGAGRAISFYNTNDYALQRSVWQLDELLKPDGDVVEGTTNWNYYYSGSTNDPPPWTTNFYKQIFGDGDVVDFNIVTSLNNRYEVMSYDAQSWTTALGATPGITNLSANLNLPIVWPPDPTGNNYTEHFWHSAEFRGDSTGEWNYWNTLLFSSSGFNISNP